MTEIVERRHGPHCAEGVDPCKRCRGLRGAEDGVPFAAGNTLSLRHGAYRSDAVLLSSDPRTEEIVEQVRASMPVCSPADEIAARMLGVNLRRAELALAALEQVDRDSSTPLSQYLVDASPRLDALRRDVRLWLEAARKLANDLGMTPSSRAALGLDVAMTRRTLSLIEMHEQLREEAS